MRPWRIAGIFLALCVLSQFAWAQSDTEPRQQVIRDGPIEIRVSLSKTTAMVAEPVTLSVQVDATQGTVVTMPKIGESLGDFTVIDAKTVSDVPLDGARGVTRWASAIVIESLETGEKEIPPLEILYQSAGAAGKPQPILSKPIPLEIVSVLEEQDDPAKFRDLKKPAQGSSANQTQSGLKLIWIAVAAAGLLIASAILGWSLRRKRPEPRRLALAQVAKIESRHQSGEIGIAESYSQLSAILRAYLDAEHGTLASSKSSEELIVALSRLGMPGSLMARFERFTMEADRVKFGGSAVPSGEGSESLFELIRALIHATGQESLAAQNQEPL